jgi:hypothetical protein
LVGQSWSGAMPDHIAVSSRRRDGWTTAGGYKHGEFAFNVPPQVSLRDTATVDERLLAGLDASNARGTAAIDRLGTALPFVSLANTDDDMMTPEAEVILLGSAFDQLLPGHSSARALAERFGALFGQFGSVTVAEALVQRPGIQLDPNRVYAAAQLQWWVHRKWMEELYFVRSKAVHHGRHDMRTWGWHCRAPNDGRARPTACGEVALSRRWMLHDDAG